MTNFINEYANSRRPLGFTPVPNTRIEAAIAATALALLEGGLSHPREVHREAVRQVARTLPAPAAFVRQLRLPRPSKNDCPIYRKQACAAA